MKRRTKILRIHPQIQNWDFLSVGLPRFTSKVFPFDKEYEIFEYCTSWTSQFFRIHEKDKK